MTSDTPAVLLWYCVPDRAFAERLAADLEQAGFEPGLYEAVADFSASESLVLIMSEAARDDAGWTTFYQRFARQGKRICTARVDAVDLPSELARMSWVDFSLGYQVGVNGLRMALMSDPVAAPDLPPLAPSIDASSTRYVTLAIQVAIVLLILGLIVVFLLLNNL